MQQSGYQIWGIKRIRTDISQRHILAIYILTGVNTVRLNLSNRLYKGFNVKICVHHSFWYHLKQKIILTKTKTAEFESAVCI